MGYNDDGIVKVDQEFFEPFDSRKIKMVGRLIEEKDIRVSKKCLCQKNLDLLASGKVSHLCIVEFGFDAKSVKKSCGIGFCFPAVHLCEFTFEFACTDSIFVSEIFLGIDGFFFFHNLIQSGISHNDGIKNLKGVVFEVILLQERKTLTGSDHNVSVGRLKLSGKNFKESRLTGTVGTNQTIAVSFCEFDVDIFKKSLLANTQCNIIC